MNVEVDILIERARKQAFIRRVTDWERTNGHVFMPMQRDTRKNRHEQLYEDMQQQEMWTGRNQV